MIPLLKILWVLSAPELPESPFDDCIKHDSVGTACALPKPHPSARLDPPAVLNKKTIH